MMPNPIVLFTVQRFQTKNGGGEDWNLLCDEAENIWTSGNDAKIRQIDRTGTVLKSLNIVVKAAVCLGV